MLRLLRIRTGEPPAPDLLERLQNSAAVYHADSSDASFGEWAAAGVPLREAGNALPPDAEWLLVPVSKPFAFDRREGRALALDRLASVVDRLLGPGGCPWDQEQTHESLKRHLLEEVYEVFDAIDSGSLETLKEELGDLLLQPIMHAQMEALAGNFDIADVAESICEKLVRRHPHVFGTTDAEDSEAVLANWERIKKAEKGHVRESVLDGTPKSAASLLKAFEISRRAAKAGFEWPDLESVFDKLHEEETELREALASGVPERIESEIGDLLFTAVNVARWANVEPEEALRKMLGRFQIRFRAMESRAEKPLGELSPEEWEELWTASKAMANSTQPS